MEKKKVLFSPVGSTDPIKYCRDASMLHICRVKKPDKIYLYMSQKILELHHKDDRYRYCINRLGEIIGKKFEIEIIERKDLVSAHEYNYFYDDFLSEIRRIYDRHQELGEDIELFVNMASGTPAMKSALLVLAALSDYRFTPVQVDNPEPQKNSEKEEYSKYSMDCNLDNEEDHFKNRCTDVKCENLTSLLKCKIIKNQLDAFDYHAALSLAKEIKDEISGETYRLIETAYYRSRLDSRKIDKLTDGKSGEVYNIKDVEKRKLFEYALALQLKLEKREYADFLRALTPLVVDLLELILRKKFDFRLDEYCKCAKSVRTWDADTLKEKNEEISNLLNREFGVFRSGNVYSSTLRPIIMHYSRDPELSGKTDIIVDVEKRLRNVAAHEVFTVTAEWFKKTTGHEPEEIMNIIKYLFVQAGITKTVTDNSWHSYRDMNAKIKEKIDAVQSK